MATQQSWLPPSLSQPHRGLVPWVVEARRVELELTTYSFPVRKPWICSFGGYTAVMVYNMHALPTARLFRTFGGWRVKLGLLFFFRPEAMDLRL